MKLKISRQILENFSDISWKSAQWESNCSKTMDGQTDMTKLVVACCNFVHVLKKKESNISLSSET